MSKKLIILMAIALTLGGFLFVLRSLQGKNYVLKQNKPKVTIGEVGIFVDIARTPAEKEKGLSGKDNLQENEGMLFVWEEPTTPGFWMKDMNFAIDIIWIKNSETVGIEKNVQPEPGKDDAELTRYYPPEPITHVLEVVAGLSDKNKIEVGNDIDFPSD